MNMHISMCTYMVKLYQNRFLAVLLLFYEDDMASFLPKFPIFLASEIYSAEPLWRGHAQIWMSLAVRRTRTLSSSRHLRWTFPFQTYKSEHRRPTLLIFSDLEYDLDQRQNSLPTALRTLWNVKKKNLHFFDNFFVCSCLRIPKFFHSKKIFLNWFVNM